jgi:hypothetical protein
MATLTSTQQRTEAVGNIARAGAFAAVAAVIGGVIVFLLATAVFGVNVVMPPDMQPMPLAAVIMASLVGAIGGTVVYAALGRFTARPVTIFRIVGLVFLVLSFGGPLGTPDLDAGTRAAMVAMHIVVGLAIIGVLTTVGRKQ